MPFTLLGYDTFDGGYYEIPGEYATEDLAREAGYARFRELETSQPTKSSGGQDPLGIQDRVYLVYPNGLRVRLKP